MAIMGLEQNNIVKIWVWSHDQTRRSYKVCMLRVLTEQLEDLSQKDKDIGIGQDKFNV